MTMPTPTTPRERAVAAIAHHLAEALLIALEAAQDPRKAPPEPVAAPPTPPAAQRAPGALLTVEDVAEKLGVAVQTIYRWRTMRPVHGPQAFKVGKYLRWKPEVVAAWLATHTET